jgi:hypothetical protein
MKLTFKLASRLASIGYMLKGHKTNNTTTRANSSTKKVLYKTTIEKTKDTLALQNVFIPKSFYPLKSSQSK